MAKRGIADDAERNRAVDLIIDSNIRRVLPTSVRVALEERILARTRAGLPPFKLREIEKECIELEKRRRERLDEAAEQVVKAKKVHAVRNVRAAAIYQSHVPHTQPDAAVTPEQSSQDEDSDLELDVLAAEVKYRQRQYAAQGKPFDKKKVIRKVLEKRKYVNYPKVAAAMDGAGGGPGSGPPIRLQDAPRRSIAELLEAANCSRGECLHCGNPGHLMKQDACSLRGKPIVDRACPACRKGLHAADDCPRVFQKRNNYIRQVDEDSDDLND